MHRRVTLLLVLIFMVCAHKAPPIAKDRLNPKLLRVEVLNTRQIQLTFSEEIDTAALAPDSMQLISEKGTLNVTQVYPSLSSSEIVIITEPMEDITYEINGAVFDKAENKGNFKKPFKGSTHPDTIAPWVVGHSQGRSTNEFFLTFTEALDTLSLAFSTIPKKKLLPVWVNTRYVRFVPEMAGESLGFDTTYYLYLKGVRDISGNRAAPFIASITPDSVYRPIILQGKAFINETPVASGLALLERTAIVAIALVVNGEFTFEVRDSLNFDVQVIAEDHSGRATVKAGADNTVRLESGKIDVDRLLD
jgi:hypothetical protein